MKSGSSAHGGLGTPGCSQRAQEPASDDAATRLGTGVAPASLERLSVSAERGMARKVPSAILLTTTSGEAVMAKVNLGDVILFN